MRRASALVKQVEQIQHLSFYLFANIWSGLILFCATHGLLRWLRGV